MLGRTGMIESDYEEAYFSEYPIHWQKIGLINVKGLHTCSYYLDVLAKLNYSTVFGLEPAWKTEELVMLEISIYIKSSTT